MRSSRAFLANPTWLDPEVEADFHENMEALKHNFFMRGYFKSRGYEDSAELAKNEIERLPQATPTKLFTYSAKELFKKQDSAQLKNHSPLLDEQGRELVVNGTRIGLTPLEFGVFAYLVARPNRAVARYELVEAVWGYGKEASTSNVVETVVRSVRQKLGAHREVLETVRGVGYRYRPIDSY